MIRLRLQWLAVSLLAGFAGIAESRAEAPAQTPDFKEVYDLVSAHLSGITPADLNRTSVNALVSALRPRVSFAGGADLAGGTGSGQVTKSSLFDGQIAYLRIERVAAGLAEALRESYQKLVGTNQPNGLVLDVRYAGGDDYAAAAAAADLFLKKERPLLDWGHGVTRSTVKPEALASPVAVLINRQTAGAAEALAAVLREAGAGLLLGSRTAGEAMVAEEYPLRDGQRLRIATGSIHLGDGSALSTEGVKPDIAVEVNPQQEKAYYADAFRMFPRTNLLAASPLLSGNPANVTNRPRPVRINEAELVRERKADSNATPDLTPAEAETPKPVVRDPALARALDVLRGLAVVRQSRS